MQGSVLCGEVSKPRKYFMITICLDNCVNSIMERLRIYENFDYRNDKLKTMKDTPVLTSENGYILICDWESKRIIGIKQIRTAWSFIIDGNGGDSETNQIIIQSWREQCIYLIRKNTIVKKFTHPWFNHMHTIVRVPEHLKRKKREEDENDHYLLTSSVTDVIMEISFSTDDAPDLENDTEEFEEVECTWNWWGVSCDEFRTRVPSVYEFDRNEDLRPYIVRTFLQAAHINSCIYEGDSTHLLATSLANNCLFRLRRSDVTSPPPSPIEDEISSSPSASSPNCDQVEVILRGLERPHCVTPRRDNAGYLVCNTGKGKVLMLNHSFEVERELDAKTEFLQAAIETSTSSVLAACNNDVFLKKSGTCLVTEIDIEGGHFIQSLVVGQDYRLYELQEISESQAKYWASAWSSNSYPCTSTWSWVTH